MQKPVQLTFRNMEPPTGSRRQILSRIDKLDRYCDRITACRVVVEPADARHNTGSRYRVRVDLAVPGDDLIVDRDHAQRADHDQISVAIRDSFNAASRALKHYVSKRRDHRN